MATGASNDVKIAQKIKLKPIKQVARQFGIINKYIESYGDYKAKVRIEILRKGKAKKPGKYIVVSGLTPTPYGEGKTVTTIGLSMALNKMKKRSFCTIREPSLGPFFGVKGGGSGGGYSQVLPYEDVNLHLNGDFHAIASAHNLCASFLDNSIFWSNPLDIDLNNINFKRVLDIADRCLRNVNIAMGSKFDGISRKSGFDITAASEIMMIVSQSQNFQDLTNRLEKIIVAFNKKGKPVTAKDLKVVGSMALLLKDAIHPNLVQTIEHTPCLVHTGPFANIAHGNSSIVADRIALKLGDYAVTESGFGADIGAEKFFDIKCRTSGLKPDLCVLVCTIRALKVHSGDFEIKSGKTVDPHILRENISSVERGCSNLDKQINNIKCFGVPVVVTINRFSHDTDKEINAVKKFALAQGADDVCVSEFWSQGSAGGMDLAKKVIDTIKKKKSEFRFLYPVNIPIRDKINRIAKTMYGAKEVVFSETAQSKMTSYKKLKLDEQPVCMAKTQLSLSHDSKRKGRPRGFKLPINDLNIANGAGFINVLCGDIKTMPGLPQKPRGEKIEVDKTGRIVNI